MADVPGPRGPRSGFREPQGEEGKELKLLRHVYGQANLDKLRGSPEKIIKLIDDESAKRHFMNIGPRKGLAISEIIAAKKPSVFVEFGGYVGYSALLFGDAVRKAGGNGKSIQYWSLEFDPVYAAIVASMIELAGLNDIVKVVVGPAGESLKRLHSEGQLTDIDMLFIDHEKSAYVDDLKVVESLGLLHIGSVVVADNILVPGAPEYVAYIKSRDSYQSKQIEFEFANRRKDAIEISEVVKAV